MPRDGASVLFHVAKSDSSEIESVGTPPADESGYPVRSVTRVLDILDVLQGAPGEVSLTELAGAAGLPKSSAFRYLATLEARSYVERDPDTGSYRIGLALLPPRLREIASLKRRARPLLEELRDRFDETVNLGVLESGRVRYLDILESRRMMRFAAHADGLDPLHSAALGKAIASTLPEEDVRSLLDREGMHQVTVRTITDPDRFMEELAAVRRRGFAIDDGENEDGGRCVAVPIPLSALPAAISISAPIVRLSLNQVEPIAAVLMVAARRIAQELEPPADTGSSGEAVR